MTCSRVSTDADFYGDSESVLISYIAQKLTELRPFEVRTECGTCEKLNSEFFVL